MIIETENRDIDKDKEEENKNLNHVTIVKKAVEKWRRGRGQVRSAQVTAIHRPVTKRYEK